MTNRGAEQISEEALEVFERDMNLGLSSTRVMGKILALRFRALEQECIGLEDRLHDSQRLHVAHVTHGCPKMKPLMAELEAVKKEWDDLRERVDNTNIINDISERKLREQRDQAESKLAAQAEVIEKYRRAARRLIDAVKAGYDLPKWRFDDSVEQMEEALTISQPEIK